MRLLVVGLGSLMLIVASFWLASPTASARESCDAYCTRFCTKNYPHSTYCTGKCIENCNRRGGH